MRVFILCFVLSTFCFSSNPQYEKSINIVTDHTNKLMWQDNIEVTQYLENYTTSKVYCDTLILNGYIDWRMPSIKELQKIVDLNKKNSIDQNFKFVMPNYYNTTTSFQKDDTYQWVVDFKSGKTITNKKRDKNYVRCVRDIK